MLDTRRSSANKRPSPSSEEASTKEPPPAAASKAPTPASAGNAASRLRSRLSKRAKARGEKMLAATAKATGPVIESSQFSVRAMDGSVPASSTVANSGARKRRTPRRLQSAEDTTAEEMTHWKTRHRGASGRTLAWGRLVSQSPQSFCSIMRHCMVVVVLLLLCAATCESGSGGRPSQSTGDAAGPQGSRTGPGGGVFGWPASPGHSAGDVRHGGVLWRASVAVAAALMLA